MKKNATLVAVLVAVLSVPALAQKKDEGGIGGINIGIGAGYTTPVNLLAPNTVSVRFQMGKLTFEPMVNLSGHSSGTVRTQTDFGDTTPDVTTDPGGGFGLGIGTDVRFELAGNSNVGFAAIAGIGFGFDSETQEDPLDATRPLYFDRTTTTTMGVGLNWGFGIDWSVTKNFVISADASNPLISFQKSTSERRDGYDDGAGGQAVDVTVNETTTANYGLIFAPRIRLMFLLMF